MAAVFGVLGVFNGGRIQVWSAASLPTALRGYVAMTVGTTAKAPRSFTPCSHAPPKGPQPCLKRPGAAVSRLLLQRPWRLPLVQHAAHGRGGCAPDGPCLITFSPACQCASGFCRNPNSCATSYSAKGRTQYRTAHFLEGGAAEFADPLPRCGKVRPGQPAPGCVRFHPPL